MVRNAATGPSDYRADDGPESQHGGESMGTDFLAQQRKIWVKKGGQLDVLSAVDRAEMMAITRTIGDDIVKTKPDLKPLWDLLRSAAKRTL